LRIVITRREFIDYVDGVNRFVFTLAGALANRGHEITLLSHSIRRGFRAQHLLDIWGVREHIAVRALEINDRHPTWSHIALDWFLKGSRLLKDIKPDAVILNGVIPLRTQSPKIAVLHSLQLPDLKPNPVHMLAARGLYRLMDRVVCVSRKASREAAAVGIHCDDIIPLPVLLGRSRVIRRSGRNRIVAHVGTRALKHPLTSVKAVQRLVESGMNIKLVIVGPKNAQTEYIERLYSSHKWLQIRNDVSNDELRGLYSRALALILPSSWESFPYAVLESLSNGTPAVVSRATPEELVTDGITGFRANSEDYDEYADKLRLLIEGTAWNRMSTNARKVAMNFEADRIAKIYERLIVTLSRSRR
jgi:glycosyltransferase involved in cell wall biosynthesis